MKTDFFELQVLTQDAANPLIAFRDGEIKLGQTIVYLADENWKSCKFHILGIAEDFGPQLNMGKPGSILGFEAFLSRFLNVQSNQFLTGNSICIHGTIRPFSQSNELTSSLIEDLDELVCSWTLKVKELGGVPIVIGGGHNNAFPLIKGSYLAVNKSINVVNMDPHADTRKPEGRHSGNSFSYAIEAGYLDHYSVLGLHEGYNNQYILDYLTEKKAFVSFFENWLEKPFKFQADIDWVFDKYFHDFIGVELDMDAICGMPSSAYTPSGITLEQARIYVRKMAGLEKVCYLHLPEAAPQSAQEMAMVGKALSYLVTDFIKEYSKYHH